MYTIEFNDKLLVNKNRKTVNVMNVTQDECNEFRRLVNASKMMLDLYSSVEEFSAFVSVYPSIKEIYGTRKSEELFYRTKLGFYYDGVPSRLTYIINKLFKKYGTLYVNNAINHGVSLLEGYVNDTYVSNGTEVTVKGVIENFVGAPVKLLTSSVRKVKASDSYEIYVPNVDRVALLPKDIANMLPYADCAKVRFDKEKGLVIGDILIRCINGRLGVTRDDFDLRNCI